MVKESYRQVTAKNYILTIRNRQLVRFNRAMFILNAILIVALIIVIVVVSG